MKEANYKIDGKLQPELLKDVPKELNVRVYAIRDRKVLGSSTVAKDGSFSIKYKYEFQEEKTKKLPLGSYLVVGPDLPEDRILKEKFPKVFLSSRDFKEKEGEWHSFAPDAIIAKTLSKSYIEKYWKAWWERFCREWRPCVRVVTCSDIQSGLCYGEEPLTNVRVRIYEVRWVILTRFGVDPHRSVVLIEEGDTDDFGYFRFTRTKCFYPHMLPTYTVLGYIVEVGQVIDGLFNSIYRDPDDQLRELKSDLCEDILIHETKVVKPQEAEGELTGSIFKLTRIGNIPVGYINQDPASPFHGYADSHSASDSATLKVRDAAFYGTLKLFANIGSGLLSGSDKVEYYRIKVSYKSNGTTIENYVQVPFYCLRETTDAEKAAGAGVYKSEFMGPSDGNVYAYPNPYDLAVDKQWIFKGLIMVLNTGTLPVPYGKFTFTVEPLRADKTLITPTNPAQELSCTILVDNTAPTGSIGDIWGPGGQRVSACGFLKLPFARTDSRTCGSNVYTRGVVNGRITVPFSAQDEQGNIQQIVVAAHFGDSNCDAPITLVGSGKKPEISTSPGSSGCGGTCEYQVYHPHVPAAQRPVWLGSSRYCSSRDGDWDECAYQFRLTIYKRLTNGELASPWWSFSKHITITRQ